MLLKPESDGTRVAGQKVTTVLQYRLAIVAWRAVMPVSFSDTPRGRETRVACDSGRIAVLLGRIASTLISY
jgi:hypothetical protein